DAQRGDLRLIETRQVGVLAEHHRPLIGARLAGDHVHHRGLAGPVRSDDRAHFTGLEHQRKRVQRTEAVEGYRDAVKIQQRVVQGGADVAHPTASGASTGAGTGSLVTTRSRRRNAPTIPRGRNSVTRMNTAPNAYSQSDGSALVK